MENKNEEKDEKGANTPISENMIWHASHSS